MRHSLISRRLPFALLLGAVLVLAGLAAPAQAATARTLSLRAGVSVVGTGAPVTFAGTLTKSPTGAAIKFQIKAGSIWLDARTFNTTNAAGAYSQKVNMPPYVGKYYFRAVAGAGGGLRSATSSTVSVTVLKKVSAKITPNKTTVNSGDLVTFKGHVTPSVTGSTVTLQRYTGASWAKVTTATLSGTGTFTRVVRLLATTSYRLSVPRHGSLAPAYSAGVKITVNGSTQTPPTITTTTLPDANQGSPYNQTLTRTGAAGTWSKTGTLPPGITLDAGTGALSGTPTTGGTFDFTARYTETASGLVATKPLSIKVIGGPVITTTSLPDGMRGDAYTKTLTKDGEAGTWSASGLPTGITLNSSTGVLSGTPTVSGDFMLNVTFFENTFKTATKQLPLHIDPSTPPHITTTSLPDGTTGTAYTKTLTKTGAAGLWTIVGSLPSGVNLNASTGVISGTPSEADDFIFTVTFTETAAQTSDSQELVLHVSSPGAPNITNSSTLPSTFVGDGYGVTFTSDGLGFGFFPWSVSKFSLPPGLSLSDQTNGKLTGKPTQAGTYRFQIKFNGLTGTQTKLFTIKVNPAP